MGRTGYTWRIYQRPNIQLEFEKVCVYSFFESKERVGVNEEYEATIKGHFKVLRWKFKKKRRSKVKLANKCLD